MRVLHDEISRRKGAIAIAACCAGLVTAVWLATAPCIAASIPAWLDEAISKYNQRNPALKIEFADIKDSFVWYRVPSSPEMGHKEVRDVTYKIVQEHGYVTTDDEELVTTGKPPSVDGRNATKKCWRRSFLLTIDKLSETTTLGGGEGAGQRQRMLTSLICDDDTYWATGFRIIE